MYTGDVTSHSPQAGLRCILNAVFCCNETLQSLTPTFMCHGPTSTSLVGVWIVLLKERDFSNIYWAPTVSLWNVTQCIITLTFMPCYLEKYSVAVWKEKALTFDSSSSPHWRWRQLCQGCQSPVMVCWFWGALSWCGVVFGSLFPWAQQGATAIWSKAIFFYCTALSWALVSQGGKTTGGMGLWHL